MAFEPSVPQLYGAGIGIVQDRYIASGKEWLRYGDCGILFNVLENPVVTYKFDTHTRTHAVQNIHLGVPVVWAWVFAGTLKALVGLVTQAGPEPGVLVLVNAAWFTRRGPRQRILRVNIKRSDSDVRTFK